MNNTIRNVSQIDMTDNVGLLHCISHREQRRRMYADKDSLDISEARRVVSEKPMQ
jgi:hypothetical protein